MCELAAHLNPQLRDTCAVCMRIKFLVSYCSPSYLPFPNNHTNGNHLSIPSLQQIAIGGTETPENFPNLLEPPTTI